MYGSVLTFSATVHKMYTWMYKFWMVRGRTLSRPMATPPPRHPRTREQPGSDSAARVEQPA